MATAGMHQLFTFLILISLFSPSRSFSMSNSKDSTVYDVVIIGGGVVGLAILRAATLEGWKCAVVEREDELLTWASGSNSGIVCTGVDASPGTLERALIRDSIASLRLFCREMNIPTRPCGSMVCRWTWDEEDRLAEVLAESHDAGDAHAQPLSPDQVLEMEPNLNREACLGGVHIPDEIVVDPWLYSIALGVHARQNGAEIRTGFEIDPSQSSFDGKQWTLRRKNSADEMIQARAVVNAAGLWADLVQTATNGVDCGWTAKPRRGQYRIFSSNTNTRITHPIQPIPTQRTKGIFVFSTLYDQIAVGPTALDQESRTDRSISDQVSSELESHIRRILPDVDVHEAYVDDYVGVRPGTDQRDYQILLNATNHWIACAGIRSTGLTASIGIGRHVVYLLKQGVLKSFGPTSNAIAIPLPDVEELVDNYHQRQDGKVSIDGYDYKVTHPLTRTGWNARTGIAS